MEVVIIGTDQLGRGITEKVKLNGNRPIVTKNIYINLGLNGEVNSEGNKGVIRIKVAGQANTKNGGC
jgi:hypothetical protein